MTGVPRRIPPAGSTLVQLSASFVYTAQKHRVSPLGDKSIIGGSFKITALVKFQLGIESAAS